MEVGLTCICSGRKAGQSAHAHPKAKPSGDLGSGWAMIPEVSIQDSILDRISQDHKDRSLVSKSLSMYEDIQYTLSIDNQGFLVK